MKVENDNKLSEEIKFIIENTSDLLYIKDKNFVYIAASKAFVTDCAKCNNG